tara:strand:+ start:128 stop:844 length:717 start_codon:yes stop_codon:yes gene_type:complete
MVFSFSLLNWKRKNNVILIVNNIVNFDCINEILISNGDMKHSVKKIDFIESDKIKIYDDWIINNDYGLDLRYVNALRAKNDDIIITDDDIQISENELNKLIVEYEKNKNRILGKWGRNIIDGKYICKDVYDNVDIVLTKLLICKKKLFYHFFICKPLIEDIYKTGIPYGNGEDIFLNFIANIYFNNKGFCLEVETKDLPQYDTSVSGNKGHHPYRKKLCDHLTKNKQKFIEFINNLEI